MLPDNYEVPRVDALENIESKGSVTVQRFKDEQWVIIKRSPGQTWPLVIQFLESNQIPLLRNEAESGVIETDWLSVDSSASLPRRKKENRSVVSSDVDKKLPDERYQFYLRQGVQKNTSEVLVKQLQRGERPASAIWQKSSDWDRQENMITLLAEHLAGITRPELALAIGAGNRVGE